MVSVMLYPYLFCVALSMDRFESSLYPLWMDHVSQRSVYCACDPNVRLDAHSIRFYCVFVCRKLSPHLRV